MAERVNVIQLLGESSVCPNQPFINPYQLTPRKARNKNKSSHKDGLSRFENKLTECYNTSNIRYNIWIG